MRTVTITSRGTDFAREMVEMRTWLDQHMLEPARFTYRQNREVVTIAVDFQSDHHAKAFRSRFGQSAEGNVPLESVRDRLSRTASDGFSTAQTPATMAQACWWRLLAEEIRTEADNFASATAKETMEMAARGWEQLAEELEHRLTRNGSQQQDFPAGAGLHNRAARASFPSQREKKRSRRQNRLPDHRNAREINGLGSRRRSSSEKVLREAKRPLRERAGKKNQGIVIAPSFPVTIEQVS